MMIMSTIGKIGMNTNDNDNNNNNINVKETIN